MTDGELEQVRAEVLVASERRESYLHGERHWRAVAHAGLLVAPRVPGCDPTAVLLFALFHDAMRENDSVDPDHGLRGGLLAQRLLGERLAGDRVRTLFDACRDHTDARTSADPTIAVCWDADRLNLWRVGIEPDPHLLSTEPARDRALIGEARHFHDGDFEWDALTLRALELAGMT